jgi:hypothetical protein
VFQCRPINSFGQTSGHCSKLNIKDITNKYPDAAPSMQQLYKVLCDNENLPSSTPILVGESKEWAAIISLTEDNRENYCKFLKGKTLFSALYGTYMAPQDDEIQWAARTAKKATLSALTVKVATKNFFAPFWTTNMDTDAPGTESTAAGEAVPEK